MRFLNVLLSVALAFKATNSKAIDYNLLRRNANTEFIENDGFKITYHCVEDYNNKCSSYKKDLKDAIDILSSTFGKYLFIYLFIILYYIILYYIILYYIILYYIILYYIILYYIILYYIILYYIILYF